MDGDSGGDYVFNVMSNTTLPFGPVNKENLDITRLIFDMTCWLGDLIDNTSDPIGSVEFPTIGLEGSSPIQPWQSDYPLDNTTATQLPIVDMYPLTVQSVAIVNSATQVEVRVSAGTPGISYVVSVVVNSELTRKRKQVDCLVAVEYPLNPNMVSVATPDPQPTVTAPLVVYGTTTLPMGYDGRIYVENAASAPITITLPIVPNQGQRVAPVDIAGNAATYPITYAAGGGVLIYGDPTFVSDINYDDLIFEFTGDHWIVLTSRYPFIG